MTIYILAALLALADLWLAYYLYYERQHHQADNDRSDRTIEWWRHYSMQLKREREQR